MPILRNDRIETTPLLNGLNFNAANETWAIAAGVLVFSEFADGIFSDGFLNNTLINLGNVISDGVNQSGVFLNGGNTFIRNSIDAEISGLAVGVLLDGSSSNTLINLGTILGDASIGVDFSLHASRETLNNRGCIFGAAAGVNIASNMAGGTINNFHVIRSDGEAIEIATAAGLLTDINNAAGAIISGAIEAIGNTSGRFRLVNYGTINGTVAANFGDIIINHGKINGTVALVSGNDYFNGTGGTAGYIGSGLGNDRIIAGKGNVFVLLGGGNCTVTGGPGHDQFFFDAPLASQIEKITNFNVSRDRIELSVLDYAVGPVGHALAPAEFHIGSHATSASQRIIYNATNGFLFYDPDGNGPMPRIHFGTLSHDLNLTHGDFLIEA